MPKEKLVIVSQKSSYGAASNIKDAINMYSTKYEAIEIANIDDGFGSYENKFIIAKDSSIKDLLFNDDKLFIVDATGLELFGENFDYLKSRDVVLFWTSTHYKYNSEKYNRIRDDIECNTTFAMMDLLCLDSKSKVFMQPYNLKVGGKIFKKFTLCHSPKSKRGNLKGSNEIESVFKRFVNIYPETDYKIIGGDESLKWEECLNYKSKCHIFVDQFGKGSAQTIGKSGIEALSMGIPTLSDMTIGWGKGYEIQKRSAHYIHSPILYFKNENELFDILVDIYENYCYYISLFESSSDVFNYKRSVEYLDKEMVW